jgi:hypothetical protein
MMAASVPSAFIRIEIIAGINYRRGVAAVKNAAAEPARVSKIRPEAVAARLVITAAAAAVTADTLAIGEWIVKMAAVKFCYCRVTVTAVTHKLNQLQSILYLFRLET